MEHPLGTAAGIRKTAQPGLEKSDILVDCDGRSIGRILYCIQIIFKYKEPLLVDIFCALIPSPSAIPPSWEKGEIITVLHHLPLSRRMSEKGIPPNGMREINFEEIFVNMHKMVAAY